MLKIFSLSVFFLFLAIQTQGEKPKQFIIWNVGQGLWTTATHENQCFHFDAGGEKKYFEALFPVVKKLCSSQNLFSFSHWDLDHISFVGRIPTKINSCLLNAPGGETKSTFKKRWLAKLKPCAKSVSSIQEIMFPKNTQTTNESSRIYIYDRKILLPGDSPIKSEKTWMHSIPRSIQFLILGHHGSRSSTGVDLLSQIPTATMAVASSNSNRYGHPHIEVKKKLKKQGIALLETQIWGNIHFR